jgi:hypothetical protein
MANRPQTSSWNKVKAQLNPTTPAAAQVDPNKKVWLYNLEWHPLMAPLDREFYMIQKGGRWTKTNGETAGEGLDFHFKAAARLVWAEIKWHRWVEMFIHEFLTKRTLAVLGPASSGKTFMAAFCVLLSYYIWPTCTTVICCSTTVERLEDRIWGEIKRLHKLARNRFPHLPGHLIPYRRRIVTSEKEEWSNDGDFRNGLVGVPCQTKTGYTGLGDFAGIKNKRVILLGDELSLLPKVFVDSISNLDANPKFLAIGLGNPKDPLDALGVLAEPDASYGGWDGNIDKQAGSKVWNTRRLDGVCLQLKGSDSPNLDGNFGADLLTRAKIDRDVSFYGKDSLWYSMMNEGEMPRGQGSRRVLTKQECERFGAKLMPFWLNTNRVKIASLDAAYGGVGGDRPILTFGEFGEEMPPLEKAIDRVIEALADQSEKRKQVRHLFALNEILTVPIKNDPMLSAPDQIAEYCKAECEKRGVPPQNFIFDAGMRTALVQSFSRIWSVKVVSLDSMGRPTERPVSADIKMRDKDGRMIDMPCSQYYKNFVSEMWYSVRWIVIGGQFRGMTDSAIDEFSAREWGIVGNNLTMVEKKEDTKLKLGFSPDIADSIVYLVELARQKGFVIRRLKPMEEPEADEGWKTKLRAQGRAYWNCGVMPRSQTR